MGQAAATHTAIAVLAGCFATFFTGRAFGADSPARSFTADSPAHDQQSERSHRAGPPSDLHAAGYAGVTAGSTFGAAIGANLEYRAGPVVAGGLFESGGEVFGYGRLGVGGVLGFAARPTRDFRFEAVGILGEHFYSAAGRSDRLAYAGARAVAAYIPGYALNHFEIGVYLDFQDDLGRDQGPRSTAFFAPDPTVGFLRFGLGLQMGVTHDFF
jgi:hypothetical protein